MRRAPVCQRRRTARSRTQNRCRRAEVEGGYQETDYALAGRLPSRLTRGPPKGGPYVRLNTMFRVKLFIAAVADVLCAIMALGCAAHPSQPSRPFGQPFDLKAGTSAVLADGLKL